MIDSEMFFIVNPAAGNGKTRQQWSAMQALLQTLGVRFEACFTVAPLQATALAQEAVARGAQTIVAVGGDGTLNEVANGVMLAGSADPARTSQIRLGLVPSGTGIDFPRTFHLPTNPEAIAVRLQAGRTRPIDVGHVTCAHEGGETVERYFVNIAGLGFDGAVAARTNRSSLKALGPRLAYLLNLILALAAYHNKPVRLTVDGQVHTGLWNSVIVANCRYFGGGMLVAPQAFPDDGLLDIIVIGNMSKPEFLVNVPKVYNGTHLSHPKVMAFRARQVEVEAGSRMFLHAEGDLVGEAPARFRVIPKAISIVV